MKKKEHMLQRDFIVGSEWLYYKIYSGPKTADKILIEAIHPLVSKLKVENCIKKWFFIRYSDPEPHLRIRFLAKDVFLPTLIKRSHESLKYWIENGLVWKVQIDTYSREIERYGQSTIEFSETFFYYDSESILAFLHVLNKSKNEQLRWLYSLRHIDNLLDAFDYSLTEKLSLMNKLKTGFGEEFRMERSLKKQLDKKYRTKSKEILEFMYLDSNEMTHQAYSDILFLLSNNYENKKTIAKNILKIERDNNLEVEKNQIISSYIHMSMNRLFKSKNRLNEMVCYDFLYRYYRSENAKSR